jgi:hypothetical protein
VFGRNTIGRDSSAFEIKKIGAAAQRGFGYRKAATPDKFRLAQNYGAGESGRVRKAREDDAF